jgi:hypothetical protein
MQCRERQDFNDPSYDMKPSFFVGEPIEDIDQDGFPKNRLEIRVQASSGNLGNVITSLDGDGIDTLFVSINDVRMLAMSVGQPVALNPIDVNYTGPTPPPLRAALQLLGTCPFSGSNFLPADSNAAAMTPYTSTITFTKFGSAKPGVMPAPDFKINYGDQLEATFDLTIIDLRYKLMLVSAPLGSGHITGNFSFELRRGQAGQTFP